MRQLNPSCRSQDQFLFERAVCLQRHPKAGLTFDTVAFRESFKRGWIGPATWAWVSKHREDGNTSTGRGRDDREVVFTPAFRLRSGPGAVDAYDP